jgi:hypothetical protein
MQHALADLGETSKTPRTTYVRPRGTLSYNTGHSQEDRIVQRTRNDISIFTPPWLYVSERDPATCFNWGVILVLPRLSVDFSGFSAILASLWPRAFSTGRDSPSDAPRLHVPRGTGVHGAGARMRGVAPGHERGVNAMYPGCVAALLEYPHVLRPGTAARFRGLRGVFLLVFYDGLARF